MIGIGLIGGGHAARIQLRGWQTLSRARVVGLWNHTPARARALAAEYGVSSFDDLDALLGHPEVDAIDIATSLETHLTYARRAAAAGKHVLCQKPLAPNDAEAEALVAACAEAGVRLMVNENWHWRPWYQIARAVVEGGSLGWLFNLRLSFRKSMTVVTPEQPADRIFAEQPFLRAMQPLILLELGPHHFDVVRYLFGEPASIYARTTKVTDHVAGEEAATAILGYEDRTAVVDMSWASVGYSAALHPDVLLLEGTDGTLTVEDDGQVRVAYRDGRREHIAVDTTDAIRRSWIAALAHFADGLDRNLPFETDGGHNLDTLRLVFGAYESAATGCPVRLSNSEG